MKTERKSNHLDYSKKERRKKQKRDYATRKRQEGRKILEDLESTNKQLHRRNRRRKQQIERLKGWAMYAKAYLSLCTQLILSGPASSQEGMTSESGVTPEVGVTSEIRECSESEMASEDGVTTENRISFDVRVTSEDGMTSEASEVGVRPEMTAMSEAEVTSSSTSWPSADSTVIELGDVFSSCEKGDRRAFKINTHHQENFSLDTLERRQQTSSTDDEETFAVPDSTVMSVEEDLITVGIHDLKSLVFDALRQGHLKVSPGDENVDGSIEREPPCTQDFFLESFERGGLAHPPREITERILT